MESKRSAQDRNRVDWVTIYKSAPQWICERFSLKTLRRKYHYAVRRSLFIYTYICVCMCVSKN